ncbi:MAG: Ig-like domain-containing protein [Bacilli bacterium]|jgi:hypothetical protein
MKKKIILGIFGILIISSCTPNSSRVSLSSNDSASLDPSSNSDNPSEIPSWNGESVRYSAHHISQFGSATPAGVAHYHGEDDYVSIWNIDASLDNYGGVQTPVLALDFAKAVIFEMDVIDAYSQYIIKLAVEGELEYYYVLSDENTPGLISVNVVDSMLCQKYRERNTQPDPGYQNGWKYREQIKHCTFHVLAKGPDGERQTAELNLRHIAIYNNQAAITSIEITSPAIIDQQLARLVHSEPVHLTTSITPSTANQEVLWESANPQIAYVNESGMVQFASVGRTIVTAKSKVDQSKVATLLIDVLSGYENIDDLKTALATINYNGTNEGLPLFQTLFNTTWTGEIYLNITPETMSSVHSHQEGHTCVLENYFDANNATHLNEANAREFNNKARIKLHLTDGSANKIYRNINGLLYAEGNAEDLYINYATKASTWQKDEAYIEQGIIINNAGQPQKYTIDVRRTSLYFNDYPQDFINAAKWTIPDRTKQSEDPIIHALSPASLRLEGDKLVMKQNKYPEAKYCFGGIVSQKFVQPQTAHIQMLLQVDELNRLNDFVKTMWEIKVLYYDANGNIISQNPLKLSSGNETGFQVIDFNPLYPQFQLYLVVNGSDIGTQFAEAMMKISYLKVYRTE